ncbi:MAG: protein-glutamate O-methyltransferase CheR [Acidobacteriota bacterium]
MAEKNHTVEDLEFRLLLDAIYDRYGFDFRGYAPASLKRRVWKCIQQEKLTTVSALQDRILHDPACMERLLMVISVDTTAMFRDPGFYASLRKNVLPALKSLPLLRVWHVGCATGEEVYSTAILLHEEGLHDKCRLYATDMNEALIEKAKSGIFALDAMRAYTDNYLKAEGKKSFSEYYTAKYDNAILRPALRKNILWAQHNLVTDGSFNEFHLVMCRNVMIYFDRPLQNRVHDLIYDSLAPGGFLCLGLKESTKFTSHEADYDMVDAANKVFRRRT